MNKQKRLSDTRLSMDEAVKKGGDYESWNKEKMKEDIFKPFKPYTWKRNSMRELGCRKKAKAKKAKQAAKKKTSKKKKR